jgi:hypothetical protein
MTITPDRIKELRGIVVDMGISWGEGAVYISDDKDGVADDLLSALDELEAARPLLNFATEPDPTKRYVEDLVRAAMEYAKKMKERK